MDIIYLSPADWSQSRGRFQHLAERLAAGNRLLYADGLGIRAIGLRDWRRTLRKIGRSLLPRPQRMLPDRDLFRVAPLSLPGRGGVLHERFNRTVLSRGLRYHAGRCGMKRPLLWFSYPHPDLVAIVERLEPGTVVYDCVDHWAGFARGYADIAEAEESLIRRADLVIATMGGLVERIKPSNPNTHLVPNGVDLPFYRRVMSAANPVPADLATIPSPRVGFVGNIAEWIDLDLLANLASARPEWQFVMIGRYQRLEPRPRLANLHWLGYRDYRLIPGYLSGFEVCILPFLINSLTRDADPLKLYEYLASGRPVVSTPLPRARDFDGMVSIAEGPGAFAAAIARGLEVGSTAAERWELLGEHAWSARMGQIRRIFRETLDIELGPGVESEPD